MGGVSKPVLGYPNQGAACVALWNEGKTAQDIADLIDNSVANVNATLSSNGIDSVMRRKRDGLPHRLDPCPPSDGLSVLILPSELSALMRQAQRRGISVREVVQRMVAICAADPSLVTAILDDQDEIDRIAALRKR